MTGNEKKNAFLGWPEYFIHETIQEWWQTKDPHDDQYNLRILEEQLIDLIRERFIASQRLAGKSKSPAKQKAARDNLARWREQRVLEKGPPTP